MNPGKIVNPPKQDDRSLFRYQAGLRSRAVDDRRSTGASGAASRAPSRCATTTATAASSTPARCARATAPRGDERDLTRGRANTLRLALSGQLEGEDFAGEAVREALDLCVSCKGCKRECPTGVDMARMKIEFTAQYKRAPRLHAARSARSAHLPRYARWAARAAAAAGPRARSFPAPARCWKRSRASIARRAAAALTSARGSRLSPRRRAAEGAARSCSSPTPSTTGSSPSNLAAARAGARGHGPPRDRRARRRRRGRSAAGAPTSRRA